MSADPADPAIALEPVFYRRWEEQLARYVTASFRTSHLSGIAGRVVAPVLRIVQLWQDFQQVGISVARLGSRSCCSIFISRSRVAC